VEKLITGQHLAKLWTVPPFGHSGQWLIFLQSILVERTTCIICAYSMSYSSPIQYRSPE